MARSGVNTLTFTARDIVGRALLVCNARDVDQGLDNIDLQTSFEALNVLVKQKQIQQHLWKKTEGVVFLDVGKTDYLLGPTGDEACDFDDFIETTTDADEVATQTVISVTSTTGMNNSDTAGVMLDSGTRQWGTISAIDPGVSITVPALASAAASGNTVYTFTNLIPRPLRILPNSRFREASGASEIPINRWARKEYFDQPDKTSQGTVVNDYFQPVLDDSRYYVWQTAQNGDSLVRITYVRPLEIFVTTADDPDFPSEWFYPLVYSLAEVIAPEYKTSIERQDRISKLKTIFMDDVLGFDQETSSIDVQVDMC